MRRMKIHLYSKSIFYVVLFSCLLNRNSGFSQTSNNIDETGNTPAKPDKSSPKKKVFPYNNIISIYPFQAAIAYMTLGYELKLGEKTVLKTIAGLAEKEQNFFSENNLTQYSAYRVELQLKYFIKKKAKAFNGVYIAPFALYKSCNFGYELTEKIYNPVIGFYEYINIEKIGKANVSHVGFLVGYQAMLGESFTLDLFIGEGLMSAAGDYKYGSRVLDVYANEIRLRTGLSIGYGF